MSYDIFKQNMLAFMLNQPNITAKEQFAKKMVEEYQSASMALRHYRIEHYVARS